MSCLWRLWWWSFFPRRTMPWDNTPVKRCIRSTAFNWLKVGFPCLDRLLRGGSPWSLGHHLTRVLDSVIPAERRNTYGVVGPVHDLNNSFLTIDLRLWIWNDVAFTVEKCSSLPLIFIAISDSFFSCWITNMGNYPKTTHRRSTALGSLGSIRVDDWSGYIPISAASFNKLREFACVSWLPVTLTNSTRHCGLVLRFFLLLYLYRIPTIEMVENGYFSNLRRPRRRLSLSYYDCWASSWSDRVSL